ncbi:glycosyl transferase group 1 [Methylobacterium nodulans ORS 2060]|uniref:Glycosyl transferase group 1 n=2 Tax=Methylobacterium nodulans TaxID=114616 RepID=B8IGJ5_METNO|nr:glycosyl transferase group 1 [Methylobacterium nodulans ORS 2060]
MRETLAVQEPAVRIIHILNHCNHGHGNAHVAIDLACAQAENGCDVVYASAGGDYEGLLKSKGVKVVHITQKSHNPAVIALNLLKLIRLCQRFRPDILHAHMMTGAAIGYIASRLYRTTLITTVHNSFDPHSLLMRLGDRVVAVSEAERRSLIARGFKADRVEVVLNGPNLSPREEWLEEMPSAPDVRRPCIATVCGLHRRKGVPDLLRAFKEACATSADWTLNIVGEGPDREDLEQLASELGLDGKVRFLGSIPRPKAILRQTDIFVLASYADPCSLALAEALFAGCATVATAVGGTPELLGGGAHGVLVPPGRPDALAAALSRLMSDPAEMASRRSQALTAAGKLTIHRVRQEYDALYRRAIDKALSSDGRGFSEAGATRRS